MAEISVHIQEHPRPLKAWFTYSTLSHPSHFVSQRKLPGQTQIQGMGK